jgi:hypothetical protein
VAERAAKDDEETEDCRVRSPVNAGLLFVLSLLEGAKDYQLPPGSAQDACHVFGISLLQNCINLLYGYPNVTKFIFDTRTRQPKVARLLPPEYLHVSKFLNHLALI